MTIEEAKDKAYQSMNNYKVVDYPNNKSNLCYIFCSSNGIYSGKTEQQQIDFINNDKYEWENLSKTKEISKTANRIIYLRDVYQHSYVDGINSDINCIDKIIELCKELTKGYDVYTVGNSGGGYLALILGSTLENVKRVYSFGGLFSVYKWTGSHNDFTYDDCDFYKKHEDDAKYQKYYDIKELVEKSNSLIIHVYSSKCKPDVVQVEHIIADDNVALFGFNTSVHGKTMNGFDIPRFVSCSEWRLNRIISKYNNNRNLEKNKFSILSFGFVTFLMNCIKSAFRRLLVGR